MPFFTYIHLCVYAGMLLVHFVCCFVALAFRSFSLLPGQLTVPDNPRKYSNEKKKRKNHLDDHLRRRITDSTFPSTDNFDFIQLDFTRLLVVGEKFQFQLISSSFNQNKPIMCSFWLFLVHICISPSAVFGSVYFYYFSIICCFFFILCFCSKQLHKASPVQEQQIGSTAINTTKYSQSAHFPREKAKKKRIIIIKWKTICVHTTKAWGKK